jgi:hypothetical protein
MTKSRNTLLADIETATGLSLSLCDLERMEWRCRKCRSEARKVVVINAAGGAEQNSQKRMLKAPVGRLSCSGEMEQPKE